MRHPSLSVISTALSRLNSSSSSKDRLGSDGRVGANRRMICADQRQGVILIGSIGSTRPSPDSQSKRLGIGPERTAVMTRYIAITSHISSCETLYPPFPLCVFHFPRAISRQASHPQRHVTRCNKDIVGCIFYFSMICIRLFENLKLQRCKSQAFMDPGHNEPN
jgi:hypothetical protein